MNFFSCKAQTGEGVKLNPTIRPNLDYTTIVITENNSTIEYVGNQGIVDNLTAKGIEHPITSVSTTIMKSSMKTGKLLDNNSFSIESSFDSVSTNLIGSITKLKEDNKLIEKMEGARVYGFVSKNMKIEIDSIANLKDQSLKATLEQSVSNILSQIEFPNRRIKMGESFTIETPMKMPAENGVVMDMNIINTYKLDSIGLSLAYFTIDQRMESTTSIEGTELTMDGSGTGQMHYNIEYDSYKIYKTELEISSVVEVSGIKIKTKATTTSITRTEVKKPDDNKR